MAPFKVLYGRDPPLVNRLGRGHSPIDSIEDILHERDAVLDELHHQLLRAQQKMKDNADKKRREADFQVGKKSMSSFSPIVNARWHRGHIKN